MNHSWFWFSCHNFFWERNHVLSFPPTHPLTGCHRISSFFLEGFSKYGTWGQDNFQSFNLVPIKKICQLRILSPPELFTKHGDKIIFKGSILSPPEIVTNYGNEIIFKSFLIQLEIIPTRSLMLPLIKLASFLEMKLWKE